MADRAARSEVLKKLSDGKTLCSEMNNASSNANFLFMRRHDALVVQLESAKNSLVSQNQRAQNEMKKKLDKYRQRKRVIFRTRFISNNSTGVGPSEEGDESDAEYAHSTRTGGTRLSSIGDRSCFSGVSGGTSTVRLPSILSMSLVNMGDDVMHSTLSKQHTFQRLKRQEGMNFQVLSSKVYDFCSKMDSERIGGDPFFITVAKRRIAFTETRSRVSSAVALSVSRCGSSRAHSRTGDFKERRNGNVMPPLTAPA